MNSKPLFFLASTENYALQEVRSCSGPLSLPGRHSGGGYIYVEIDPPIIGQQFGLGGTDIDHVVLAPRHEGVTLLPLSESPAAVHVALLLKNIEAAAAGVSKEDLRLLGWGEVYGSAEEALRDTQRTTR